MIDKKDMPFLPSLAFLLILGINGANHVVKSVSSSILMSSELMTSIVLKMSYICQFINFDDIKINELTDIEIVVILDEINFDYISLDVISSNDIKPFIGQERRLPMKHTLIDSSFVVTADLVMAVTCESVK